jgi:hypothetical protein
MRALPVAAFVDALDRPGRLCNVRSINQLHAAQRMPSTVKDALSSSPAVRVNWAEISGRLKAVQRSSDDVAGSGFAPGASRRR